jgi:hypothetical protein
MKWCVFSVWAFLAMTVSAMAGTREDIEAASMRCAQIADDHAWLDCYYGAAQSMRSHLGLSPASPAQIALVPPPAGQVRPVPPSASGTRKAGLFGTFGGRDGQVHLAAYSFNHDRMFTVTLPDGEILEQMPDDTNYAHWRGPASDQIVSLTTGAFGAQTLEDEKDGGVYRVRRIR